MGQPALNIQKDTACPHCHGQNVHSKAQRKGCKGKGGVKNATPNKGKK